jgi:hypothetical protein
MIGLHNTEWCLFQESRMSSSNQSRVSRGDTLLGIDNGQACLAPKRFRRLMEVPLASNSKFVLGVMYHGLCAYHFVDLRATSMPSSSANQFIISSFVSVSTIPPRTPRFKFLSLKRSKVLHLLLLSTNFKHGFVVSTIFRSYRTCFFLDLLDSIRIRFVT